MMLLDRVSTRSVSLAAGVAIGATTECPCDRCKDARESGMSWEERLPLPRMSLCPTCGNKRCPKAAFHENQCTGSNAVGQVGSAEVASPITHPCCTKCVDLQRQLDMVLAANRTIMDELDVAKKQVADLSRIHGVDTAYLNQT